MFGGEGEKQKIYGTYREGYQGRTKPSRRRRRSKERDPARQRRSRAKRVPTRLTARRPEDGRIFETSEWGATEAQQAVEAVLRRAGFQMGKAEVAEEKREQERVKSHTSVIGTPGAVSPDNLLIMAYNINGIKGQLSSGCLRHLLQTHLPAVLCLGELKQRADRLSQRAKLLPLLREFGYHSYHFHTHDEPETGYSGTAILSRVPPLAFRTGI